MAFSFVAVPLATSFTYAQTRSASGLELAALNRGVDPCTDFYQFACGGWLAANPIPADRARWGRFDELREKNLDVLRRVLEQAAGGRDQSTKKIGDYYATCMDEEAINRRGATPLDPDLKNIAALQNVDRLPELLAELHKTGVNALFGFGSEADFKDASTVIAIAAQGGMGLPDRDYYFRDDARSVDIRKQYEAHVAKMLTLAGAPAAQANTDATNVMRIETALAKAALDVVARRNPANQYHKMAVAALQQLTPRFNWSRYLRGIAAPPFDAINVTEPDFFRAFDQLLGSTSIEDLRTYLRWHLVHQSAVMLSAPFVDENFRFYSGTLQGVEQQRPRWKRCVDFVDADLGEALGQGFVKEAFGPQAKADTLRMVHEVENELEKDITTLDWMTADTKKQALAKLHAVMDKIGYPEKWRDYSALTIERGDALGNSQRANAFEFHRELSKIGKPLDKTEWSMTPPTVNAYYNPLQNNINFPAGILQPPFYSASHDAAVNYGGAGAVIGHELTHGFDDQGRQFDAQGNLKDWWTASDGTAFEQRASCFVNQYSNYTAVDDVKLNGKLTLGENTADNGGLRLAFLAYVASQAGRAPQTLDGFTPDQRVFLGWAQVWCENRRPQYERLQAQTNPHSPGRYRVNGVVSNMPEFQKAFSCKSDAPMAKGTQCRVW
ncbi:MAG TPA: M13 family metallopeptidase [Vicinamibacterales bacterium]|jgi:endothelin-converting enzyme/putative endopeptidase